jgi:glutathione peroxidase
MINRRTFIAGAFIVAAGQPSCSRTVLAQGAMSKISAYAFSFPALPGLVIIGVPSNDFGGQEPGGPKEIAETQHHYGVTFPIAGKVVVKGPNAHPFYKWAAETRPKEVPRWNFHKYLVGREGYISEVFAENVEPTDTRVKTAIARALAAS